MASLAAAQVGRHWTRIGWSIVPLHQAQGGCRRKGDILREANYSRKPLHFPHLFWWRMNAFCILPLIRSPFSAASRRQQCPKICTKSPIGAPLLAFSHPNFFVPAKVVPRQYFANIYLLRAASDAFDVRTRTRFVDEEKIDSPSAERRAIINRSALHVIGLIQAMI